MRHRVHSHQLPIYIESEEDTTLLTLETGVGVDDLVEIVVEGLLVVVTVGVVTVVDVAYELLNISPWNRHKGRK